MRKKELRKVRGELKEVADEFLQQIKEYVHMLLILDDSTTLKELVTYYSRFTGSEFLRKLQDAGLQQELNKLADKAGQSQSSTKSEFLTKTEAEEGKA
jgi:hypothetical protein